MVQRAVCKGERTTLSESRDTPNTGARTVTRREHVSSSSLGRVDVQGSECCQDAVTRVLLYQSWHDY